jgi:hypothetical protein
MVTMGQWSDFYLDRWFSPAEMAAAIGAVFGVDSGTIEIVEDPSTISDRCKLILGIMTRYEPDFPLRLEIAIAAGWSELTFALALSKTLHVRVLLDDAALPSTSNAFLYVEPAGTVRPVTE